MRYFPVAMGVYCVCRLGLGWVYCGFGGVLCFGELLGFWLFSVGLRFDYKCLTFVLSCDVWVGLGVDADLDGLCLWASYIF